MSSTYVPGGSATNRSCPFSLVMSVACPPISAGELTRTTAPGRTPPCASLTVPMMAPVNPCAAVATGNKKATASVHRSKGCRIHAGDRFRLLIAIKPTATLSLRHALTVNHSTDRVSGESQGTSRNRAGLFQGRPVRPAHRSNIVRVGGRRDDIGACGLRGGRFDAGRTLDRGDY